MGGQEWHMPSGGTVDVTLILALRLSACFPGLGDGGGGRAVGFEEVIAEISFTFRE